MEDETFFGQGVWPSRVASKFYSFFGVRALPDEANLKFRNSWGGACWLDGPENETGCYLPPWTQAP